ncbi:MAG: hypothetical protein JXR69_00015 [Candidatus Delongbacteria bacterium]|nr:hypothetical protein [Candidatus Delongbacteria bacterium]
MRKVILFGIVVMLLIFNACEKKTNYTVVETEDGKVIINKKISDDPELKVNLKYTGQINSNRSAEDSLGFFWMSTVHKLPGDNILVQGYNPKGRLTLYNSNFKFIRSFSPTGQGPGENEGYSGTIIINNKIYAFFSNSDKVNIFDLSGEYIESFNLGFIVTEIHKLSEHRIIATKWEHLTLDKDSDELTIENILMDNDFNQIKVVDRFYKIIEHGVAASSQMYPFICGNETNLYISWISDSEYKIDVYDSNTGDKKYQIKKDFRSYFYKDIEMDRMSELNGINMKEKFGNIKKRAINEIFVDKYNRLWVLATNERNSENLSGMYVDIFKNGIYQNSIQFKDLVYYDGTGSKLYYRIRFIGDKLIYFNADEFDDEKGRNIKFYDY